MDFYIERINLGELEYFRPSDRLGVGNWVADPMRVNGMSKKEAHKVISWMPDQLREHVRIVAMSY